MILSKMEKLKYPNYKIAFKLPEDFSGKLKCVGFFEDDQLVLATKVSVNLSTTDLHEFGCFYPPVRQPKNPGTFSLDDVDFYFEIEGVFVDLHVVSEGAVTIIPIRTASKTDIKGYIYASANKEARIKLITLNDGTYDQIYHDISDVNARILDFISITTKDRETQFEKGLQTLINCNSIENESDTPDFILAQYIRQCLDVYKETVKLRDHWYGVNLEPGNSYFIKE